MKLAIKVGDKVQVVVGKLAGKEAAIIFIDKKNNRVRLEGLKVVKAAKGKKGGKDLHGTFHVSSLKALPKPAAAAPAEEAKA
jgi:ribosomal protein L24